LSVILSAVGLRVDRHPLSWMAGSRIASIKPQFGGRADIIVMKIRDFY